MVLFFDFHQFADRKKRKKVFREKNHSLFFFAALSLLPLRVLSFLSLPPANPKPCASLPSSSSPRSPWARWRVRRKGEKEEESEGERGVRALSQHLGIGVVEVSRLTRAVLFLSFSLTLLLILSFIRNASQQRNPSNNARACLRVRGKKRRKEKREGERGKRKREQRT